MSAALPLVLAAALPLGLGFAFGVLLHRGRVCDCNVIEAQFTLSDFTMVRVMLTAVIVGGLGVFVLTRLGLAHYAPKDANLLGVALGAAMFGAALVFFGYCPGTGLAAAATGSLHAWAGLFGMLAGAIAYAFSYGWLRGHVLNVWAYGKLRLPELTGISEMAWFAGLTVFAAAMFFWIERRPKKLHSKFETP